MTPGQSDHNCPELDWAKPRFSGHTELGFLACLLLPCGLLPKLLLPHESLRKRLVECQLSRNSLMWFRGFLCGGSGLLTWTSRAECWAVFVLPLDGDLNPADREPPSTHVHLFLSALRVQTSPSQGRGTWSCPKLGLRKSTTQTFRNVT